MEQIKLTFDSNNNTLMLWFDDPSEMAYLSPIDEDTPGDWHLLKSEDGQVIGLECQLYHKPLGSFLLDIEQVVMPVPNIKAYA